MLKIHSCDKLDNLYKKIINTNKSYYGFNYTKERIDRLAYSWINKDENISNSFIIEDEKEAFLLSFFQEGFAKTKYKYVVDYVDRLYFYSYNLWEESLLLKEFKEKINLKENKNLPVPYFENNGLDFKSFIKTVKNNYNSHFFGKKSNNYNIKHIIVDSTDKLKSACYTILQCLDKYGCKRYKYLKDTGESWISPELYDILFSFNSLYHSFKYSDSSIGITEVYNADDCLIGFLTWYKIKDTAYLDEIVIDKGSEYKSLSLYRVVTLHSTYFLFQKGIKKVLLGFCTNEELTEYKNVFPTKELQIKLYEPQFDSIEEGMRFTRGL